LEDDMSECERRERPVGPCRLPCPRCGEERWGIHRNEVPATSITRYGFVCDYCWQYAPESLHCHPTLGPVALGSCYAAAINFRLEQHRENLGLWESGFLAPTEPDPDERRRVMDHLRVAIHELEEVLKEACGGRVESAVSSVERAEPGPIPFILNGRDFALPADEISYAAAVKLAGGIVEQDGYTVTYYHGRNEAAGTLAPGESVLLGVGMVFNVVRTDGA
jgi:hypothetical protein